MGRAMFSICAALAELERSIIVERSVEGQRRARARGKHVGRPRRQVDARRILRLHGEGQSLRAIAQETGVSRTVVTRVVREAALKLGLLSHRTRRRNPCWSRAGFERFTGGLLSQVGEGVVDYELSASSSSGVASRALRCWAIQPRGVSSAIKRLGWWGTRSITSLRYVAGSIPSSLQLATSV